MSDTLEMGIRKAEHLARNCDFGAALKVTDELVRDHAEDARAWSTRAYIHELAEDHAAARSDLDRAIEMQSPDPALLFTRARMSYLLAELDAALADVNEAIRLTSEAGGGSAPQEMYCWRAAALIGLNRLAEARHDLGKVDDGFCIWTNGLVTKADLLAHCE